MRQSAYGRLRAQEYDIGTDHSEIVEFYLEQWNRLGKPTPVLEPMCGTGINLIPFLEAGIESDGLDSSPFMLELCREKCQKAGLESNLYEQFLEQMELPRKYGFIFIPGGSFGHIYDKTIAAECLKRIREHLLPGGWLVLDVRSPAFMSNFGKPEEVEHELDDYPDGSTVFRTGYWQHLDGGRVIRCWNKMEQFIDGSLIKTEVFDYRERMYDLNELRTEVRAAGYDEIRFTKAYIHEAEPKDGEGIVLSCQRR